MKCYNDAINEADRLLRVAMAFGVFKGHRRHLEFLLT